MKALICIARVPDTTAKIAFNASQNSFEDTGVQWIINPYDEWYALSKALELKEQGKLSEVNMITVGGSEVEPILRKALALGGDKATRIDHIPQDSASVALLLSKYVYEYPHELILGGKETIDYNHGSVLPMLATYLNKPFIGQVTKLDIQENALLFSQQISLGLLHGKTKASAVIACQKGLAEPRIASMKGVMSARTKPIEVKTYPLDSLPQREVVCMKRVEEQKEIQWIKSEDAPQLFTILKEKHKLNF